MNDSLENRTKLQFNLKSLFGLTTYISVSFGAMKIEEYFLSTEKFKYDLFGYTIALMGGLIVFLSIKSYMDEKKVYLDLKP